MKNGRCVTITKLKFDFNFAYLLSRIVFLVHKTGKLQCNFTYNDLTVGRSKYTFSLEQACRRVCLPFEKI